MSGMVFRPRRGRRDVTLNVTSLIDVLFLLLIFFMLTGTFKRAGELELRLPESSSSAPTADREPSRIELVATEGGLLLLDERPVPLRDLKRVLRERLEEDPDGRVMIRAEAGVPHGEIVRLLDIVRESGFRGVGIGTLLSPGEASDSGP